MPLFAATHELEHKFSCITNIVSDTLSVSLSQSQSLSDLCVSAHNLDDLIENNTHPISNQI
jgi:hypothetical protein